MTELYPADADLNALSGTNDNEQEVLFIATGESPYYTSFYKMLHRLLNVARRGGDLRLYKDGQLTFGVRAGKFMDGATVRDYAGVTSQALTDNATNYIFLTAAGVLTTNTTGFPAAGTTPHIPLATIVTSSGSYSHTNITDYRGRAMFRPLSAMTPAAANTLVSGASSLAITAGAEAADARTITVQAKDANGVNLSQRFRVRLWIATSDFGAPDATGNSVSITTGTLLRQITANSDYEVITNSSGQAGITVTITGAATRYFMADVDGRVYSSGAIAWSA